MGRYKYLLKNVGLLTISNFATKLLSFFLVPLYTSVLTTGEYGTYDVFYTTVGVLLPIVTLNIQEGALRFSLERDYDRDGVATVGFRCTLLGTALVMVGLLIVSRTDLFELTPLYSFYFLLMFASQAFSGLLLFYARGLDKIADLSISGVLGSFITIVLNVVLLVPLNMGLDGYFLANILGPLSQLIFLVIKTGILKHIRLFSAYKVETKELIVYSLPLAANSIAWWVTSVSDRYVVIFFCGLAANGIYSVASKIPSILSILQNIFSQAWTLSVVKDYDPDDSNGFFAQTYSIYNCMLTIVCSAIIVLDKVFARFLYANDFFVAWQYVPWLTIAIIFGALSNYLGGFFTAVKDTKSFATSSAAGAITNLVLNLIFVPFFGPMAAAISTTICYVEVWILRLVRAKRYVRIRINLVRDVATYALLIAQSLTLLLVTDEIGMYALLSALFIVVVVLYAKDLVGVTKKLFSIKGVR